MKIVLSFLIAILLLSVSIGFLRIHGFPLIQGYFVILAVAIATLLLNYTLNKEL